MARILIVDDEEGERLLLRSLLEAEGHELLFAPHGQAALRQFKGHGVDLVVTDLAMPELNGLRLIQELRRIDPVVRIVAISGVNAENLDLAESLGAARTVVKPVTRETLLQAVDEALNQVRFREDRWVL